MMGDHPHKRKSLPPLTLGSFCFLLAFLETLISKAQEVREAAAAAAAAAAKRAAKDKAREDASTAARAKVTAHAGWARLLGACTEVVPCLQGALTAKAHFLLKSWRSQLTTYPTNHQTNHLLTLQSRGGARGSGACRSQGQGRRGSARGGAAAAVRRGKRGGPSRGGTTKRARLFCMLA